MQWDYVIPAVASSNCRNAEVPSVTEEAARRKY